MANEMEKGGSIFPSHQMMSYMTRMSVDMKLLSKNVEKKDSLTAVADVAQMLHSC